MSLLSKAPALNPFTLALVQLGQIGSNKTENLKHARDMVLKAAAGKDGKPTTLGDIAKQVMAQYKVKLDASTNQKSRQTTFYLKAESKKELDKAKRSLLALLSPVVRVSALTSFCALQSPSSAST